MVGTPYPSGVVTCAVRPDACLVESQEVAMKRSQLLVVLAAVVAVAVVGLGSRGDEKQDGEAAKTSTPAPAPTNAIAVSVASSPEKLGFVEKAAAAYNATEPHVNGRPVVVRVRSANSGDEEAAIARGDRNHQPVVWSPASSLWARLLEYDADRDLVPENNAVDRPLAARAGDVGAARACSRLAEQADRVQRRPAARPGSARLGRPRASRVRGVQTRPHESRRSRHRGSRQSAARTTR